MDDPLNSIEDFVKEQNIAKQIYEQCYDYLSSDNNIEKVITTLGAVIAPQLLLGAGVVGIGKDLKKWSGEVEKGLQKIGKYKGKSDNNVALSELMGMEDERLRIEEENRREEEEKKRIVENEENGEEQKLRKKLEHEARLRQEEEERQRTHEKENKRLEAQKKHAPFALGIEGIAKFIVKKMSRAEEIKKPTNVGLQDMQEISGDLANGFREIAELEKIYESKCYDNLILLQCVQLERFLVDLLLDDSAAIEEQIKKQLRPRQKDIIEYYFSKEQNATLGFVQLWLIGLRRALNKARDATKATSHRWIEERFGPVKYRGGVCEPLSIFTDKELIAFTNRLREEYRNPLVHQAKKKENFDIRRYRKWCKDSYGKKNVGDWLKTGWTGVNGWISILAASKAQSTKLAQKD